MDAKKLKKNMENFVGKDCTIIGDHVDSGETGFTDRVEMINGIPTMIVKLDIGTETKITSNENIMFTEPIL